MRLPIMLILAGSLVSGSQNVLAQQSDTVILSGGGARSCGQMLADVEEDDVASKWLYLSWAQGYMSAVNLEQFGERSTGQLSLSPPPEEWVYAELKDEEAQWRWLVNYCNENPLVDFQSAVVELYGELPKGKVVLEQ